MSAKVGGIDALNSVFEQMKEQLGKARPWQVATNVEYAKHVEFGTSRQRAQPYMRPAVEKATAQLEQLAARTIGSGKSSQELIKTVAFFIEAEAKRVVAVDTGNLRNSITAREASRV